MGGEGVGDSMVRERGECVRLVREGREGWQQGRRTAEGARKEGRRCARAAGSGREREKRRERGRRKEEGSGGQKGNQ